LRLLSDGTATAHLPDLPHRTGATGGTVVRNFEAGNAPGGCADALSEPHTPCPSAPDNGRPRSGAGASMRSDALGTARAKAGISADEAGRRKVEVPGGDREVATSAAVHGTRAAAAGTYADAHGSEAENYVRQAI